jgi:hypothetical protein
VALNATSRVTVCVSASARSRRTSANAEMRSHSSCQHTFELPALLVGASDMIMIEDADDNMPLEVQLRCGVDEPK